MKPALLIFVALLLFSCNVQKKTSTPSNNIEDYAIIEILPNVFSPGQLCFEEIFRTHPYSEVTLYNRWGTKVWITTDSLNCWNGTHYQTKDTLPPGIYYYVACFPIDSSARGTITLIF
jgi:hypothetical protein